MAMNLYADAEYDGICQQNFYNHPRASGFGLGGGDMINLNLIDDSNSVCEQLSKVEAFARMQPRKLIPKNDKNLAPYYSNGAIQTNNNLFNGGESQSALSMSARAVINQVSPRGALFKSDKVETKGSLNGGLNVNSVSSTISKNGIATNNINNNLGNNFNNFNDMLAATSSGAGNGDVKKITI